MTEIIAGIQDAVESMIDNQDVEVMNEDGLTFACEADMYYHDVFDVAMEGKDSVLSNDERKKLPDSSFGLIYKDENGKEQRKYPLIVPDDIEKSKRLQRKALAFFHYCAPKYKKALATAIVDAIATTKSGVRIDAKSQIHVFVKVPDEIINATKDKED